ncbi:MAG: ATP synthase F1 subunit epsilon [Actinobacteria bacterium]|jgi:F-type H+-transporting ATPase subunit epsilon|nr:ATP synthase F1 subunit epsilon [Actinomycetota bacterium]
MADREDSLCLRLELVAPAGLVFEGDAEMVVLPAVTGEVGILPRHAPLVAQLTIGRLRALLVGGDWVTFAVAEGFAKVQFNKVIVLADAAEEASQIDVDRVNKSIEKATKRLEMVRLGTVPEGEDVDPYREQLALKRAHNRLKVAERLDK